MNLDRFLAPRSIALVGASEGTAKIGGRSLLLSLCSGCLFHGEGGAPPVDLDALAALVVQRSALGAAAGPMLTELDLNPVFVHAQGRGVTVADALAVVGVRPAADHCTGHHPP